MKSWIITVFFFATLLGCASVPMGDPEQDAALKTFTVPPGQAGLFIYRDQIFGSAVKLDVQVDGTPLGQTAVMTYLFTPVTPGKHVVSSSAKNTASLELNIEPDSVAYVRQQLEMGPRVDLYLMGEEEGRQGVQACKLAKNTPAEQEIEVRVVADDPAWSGPLECEASNTFGTWPFLAPGTVTVVPAATPLRITCKIPASAAMEPSITTPSEQESLPVKQRKGATVGAGAGAVAGAALGAAAVPVMGPAVGIFLAVGSTFQGAELGGLVGAVTAGEWIVYPGPITLHIRNQSPTE